MTEIPCPLAITGDETGSIAWRIWQPFAELRKHGMLAHSVHTNESVKFLPAVAAGVYNCVVTPRLAWPDKAGEPWQKSIRSAGLTWIYEIDDDVYSSAIVERQYTIFPTERARGLDGLEQARQDRISVLSRCDAITVSCQRLASVVRRFVADDMPVYVLPNSIDAKWFAHTLKGCGRLPELEGKITIGWAGGTRQDIDLAVLLDAWKILCDKYPDVVFIGQGHISERLVSAIPEHRRLTLPWLPLSEYPRAMLNFDIGCCSVAPTLFNTAKTPIKWFEMTLAGVPCVVSPTLYGPVVTDGENALVARTTEDWVSQLSSLIESAELRRKIQRAAFRTVTERHSLQENWMQWPLAYADAVERHREKNVRKLILARA